MAHMSMSPGSRERSFWDVPTFHHGRVWGRAGLIHGSTASMGGCEGGAGSRGEGWRSGLVWSLGLISLEERGLGVIKTQLCIICKH